MHAVRKQILEILKKTGGSTVAELAAQLDMAPVSVRHHLDILQGDGLICVERVARKGSVGRPQQIYALTAEANAYFPNNYASLAEHLVRQIKQLVPHEQVEDAFQAMAVGIAAEITAEMGEDGDNVALEKRLERATMFLNQRGYLACWDVVESADEVDESDCDSENRYLLHKYNCPYADVSTEHSELCLMDQALINELLGRPCQRISSMAEDGGCCTYLVGPVEGNQRDSTTQNVEWADWTAPTPAG